MSDTNATGPAEGSPPCKYATNTQRQGFQPGNPGRPRGSRNKVTVALERLLDGQAEALMQRMVSLALEGDIVALKYCLDKIIPPKRSLSVKLDIPAVKTHKDALKASTVVIDLLAAGEISQSDAEGFLGSLCSHLKIISAAKLDERVQRLEENSGRKGARDMTPEERRLRLVEIIRQVQEEWRQKVADGSVFGAEPISE